MTYPGHVGGDENIPESGFTLVCNELAKQLIADGSFPITQENYYRPLDHQSFCSSDGDCPWYMKCSGTQFADQMYCEARF